MAANNLGKTGWIAELFLSRLGEETDALQAAPHVILYHVILYYVILYHVSLGKVNRTELLNPHHFLIHWHIVITEEDFTLGISAIWSLQPFKSKRIRRQDRLLILRKRVTRSRHHDERCNCHNIYSEYFQRQEGFQTSFAAILIV
jgi:hypothetical protein